MAFDESKNRHCTTTPDSSL